MNRDKLKAQLMVHEGVRLVAYEDSEGYWTIGIGHLIDSKITGDKTAEDHFREGGIDLHAALTILDNDIDSKMHDLDLNIPWWKDLDDVRQRVILDMAFNMGVYRLLQFHNTLYYIQHGKYNEAANAMMQSLWYKQVGKRAERLVRWMRTGIEDWK